jgi:RNA polymerase sigma-70 factor, ECF subfamily
MHCQSHSSVVEPSPMSDPQSPIASNLANARADQDRAQLAALLVQSGTGDAAAFKAMYRRTSAKLFGVCLRIFGDRTEAEDALQDAYITIWNKAATFDPARASPITWLVTVARNRAIDRWRSGGKARLAPLDEASEVADPAPRADQMLASHHDDVALGRCIEALESRDAEFIQSAFMKGATYGDLAARDGLPLGTVKSRIRRALLKLRDCLGGQI